MKKFTLFTILLISILIVIGCEKDTPSSQDSGPSEGDFNKTFGGSQDDQVNVMMELNGFLYMFGTTKSFDDTNGDHYLIKLNFFGEIEFIKTYGGDMAEEGLSMITTSDGNILLAGSTESAGFGMKDMNLVKINPDGDVIWSKTFGGAMNDKATEVIEKSTGEYVLVGNTESFGSGEKDIYVVRVNQNGSLLSEVHFGNEDHYAGTKILEEQGNFLIVYGWTQGIVSSERLIYMMRINSLGDSTWSQTYGEGNYQESQAIIKTNDGGYLINGHTTNTDPDHNMFALKLDGSLNEVWHKEYGGDLHDGGEAVMINSEGNYMFLGNSSSFTPNNTDIFYTVTSPQGDSITQVAFELDGNQLGEGLLEYGDHYYFAGSTDSLTLGGTDAFLIKRLKVE